MITKLGKELWAKALSGVNNGYTGTATSFTATTLKATAAGWTVNAFTGQAVYVGNVVGTILSNTSEVLTIARWETPAKRGEATAETPVGTPAFSIADGANPAGWMAISASTAEPKEENTTLAGEITTAEGGLLRALATFKYLGSNKYEVKATFKANGKDALPVTIAKMAIFNASREGIMLFESLLSATAELKVSGDSVTITDTVTGT